MRALLLITALMLGGCAHPNSAPATLYDYRLTTAQGEALTLAQAARRVSDADIILVGELHTHPAIHLLQARLLAELSQGPRSLALSLEQFSRADQGVLDAYLAGQRGESALIRDGHAWPNYPSDYRPLVEFAKAHHLPVIAANAPKALVSCIGEQGPQWLEQLPPSRRAQLARTLTLKEDDYQRAFMASQHHGDRDANARRFAAQTAWDDTMAESMVAFLARHPGRRLMHIAGNFHVQGGLGLASRIAARNPALTLALITPVTDAKMTPSGRPADVEVHVAPLPERWKSREEMKQDMASLQGARARDCRRWLQP